MPRYCFGYPNSSPETEGEELPDDAAARRVAEIIASELRRDVVAFKENGQRVEEAADPAES